MYECKKTKIIISNRYARPALNNHKGISMFRSFFAAAAARNKLIINSRKNQVKLVIYGSKYVRVWFIFDCFLPNYALGFFLLDCLPNTEAGFITMEVEFLKF
jgi:hypothetical protein